MLKEVDESKFCVCRAVIYMAYADKKFKEDEKSWIQDLFKNFPFTDEQKKILASDLKSPPTLSTLFDKMDKKDRANILHFARVIFHIDGEYHPDEKKIYEQMHQEVMRGLNLQEPLEQISTIQKNFEVNNESSFREKVVSFFDAIWN